MKPSSVAVLAAGVLALGLDACAENNAAKVTDLNNLQGDVIGKVNCSAKTFALDADQAQGFAEFAGQWMTAEAFETKWVEVTGDTYGSQLAMQAAEAAMGEACDPEELEGKSQGGADRLSTDAADAGDNLPPPADLIGRPR